VVGQTNTCNRHEELRTLGIVPVTRNQQNGDDKFPFVVFSAPPSGSEDYVAEIRAAAQRWNGEGSLLLTSSSAVYDVSDNSVCDEISPLVAKGRSPRTDLLLNAEEEVLKVGGNVVRLAGLYISSIPVCCCITFFHFLLCLPFFCMDFYEFFFFPCLLCLDICSFLLSCEFDFLEFRIL
jgi:hypothetical protein